MHEFSLMASLLRQIEEVARQEKANKVTSVHVEIGALAHISANHFREHFEEGIRGTIAENAALIVDECDDQTHPQAQDIVLKSVEVDV